MSADNYLGELFDFSESKPKRKKAKKSALKKNILNEDFSLSKSAATLEKPESQSRESRKPMSVSTLTRQIRRQIEKQELGTTEKQEPGKTSGGMVSGEADGHER